MTGPLLSGMDIEDKLMNQRVTDPDSGCWLWQRHTVSGYGHVRWQGRDHLVHRVAHILWVGPIPPGYTVDHTCHNDSGCNDGPGCLHRRCFNPAHLETVTSGDNSRRSPNTQQSINLSKTHCKWGHELTPENMYVYADGRHCKLCIRRREDDRRRGTS